MEDIMIYTWENVLCNYEIGSISVIARSIADARTQAIIALHDSDDQHYVEVSEPSTITPLTIPYVFTCEGSN